MDTKKILDDLLAELAKLNATRDAILAKIAPLQAAADAQAEVMNAAIARHRELAQQVVDVEEAEGLRALSLERGKLGRAIAALQGGHAMTAEPRK